LKLTAVAQQKAQSDMAELETTAAMVYEQASVEAAGLQAKSYSHTRGGRPRLKQLNASMEQESAAILSSFTGTIDSDLDRHRSERTLRQLGASRRRSVRAKLSAEHAR
jgi:hypothetical protein